jgi:isochorismate synthase
MKAAPVKGSVIWKLPGSQEIYVLDQRGGDDMFLLSCFDKALQPYMLKGGIKMIELHEVPSFFKHWDPVKQDDISSTTKEEYMEWVKRAKKEIDKGYLHKVVLAQKQWQETSVGILTMFDALMKNNPNAFVYAFHLENSITMLGASPENLLRHRGGILYTEALGGTKTREQYTEKEFLEHRHISNYIEEILSRKTNALKKGEMTTRRAGLVEHLLTPFELPSSGMENDLDLAYALHPTPAVCGMPYKEAVDFIMYTENFDRKFYSGFLGPVAASGDFSLFVNLRCAEYYRNGVLLYAGAGLNNMSDPKDEWLETMQKMQTILRCIS